MVSSKQLFALRSKAGLTQDYVAKKLGILRQSYMAVEKGTRELTLSEASTLADLYGITLEQLIQDEGAKAPIGAPIHFHDEHDASGPRIGVPKENLKKFREVLLYILEKVGSRANVGMTVLYKLLYFADFDYYEKYEEPLIGATYIKNKFGPTPVSFAKLVEAMEKKGEVERVKSKYFQHDQTKFLPRRSADLSMFSAQEKEMIDAVIARLGDKSAKELSVYSHTDTPWAVAEVGKPIAYETVFYRDAKHSVQNEDDAL